MRLIYKFVAFLIRGKAYKFEGRDRNRKWHSGYCIMSRDAMIAHTVVFRLGACLLSETAMSEA